MHENAVMFKAIQGSLDNIQYTVEDMKIIANHVYKIPREQQVKLQHITLLTKHILSICNFILSLSTADESNDISIPNIVENIMTCCRKIENITSNTKGLLSYEDSLKLIHNINNIFQLRNRIYTMVILGKYINQDKYNNVDDGQETLTVNKKIDQVNENENISRFVNNDNLSDSSHFQYINTTRNNVCTIKDYICYLFDVILPKYIQCTLRNKNTKTNRNKIISKQINIISVDNDSDKTNMSIEMPERYSFLFQEFDIPLQSNTNSGDYEKSNIFNEEPQHIQSSDTTLHNTLDYNDSWNIVSVINEITTISTSSIELPNPNLGFVEQDRSISSNNVVTSTIHPLDFTSPIREDYISNTFSDTEYSSTTTDYDGTTSSYDEQNSSSLIYQEKVLSLVNIEETSTMHPSDTAIPIQEDYTSNIYSNTEYSSTTTDYDGTTPSYDEEHGSSLLNHDQTDVPLVNIEETTTSYDLYSNTDSYYDYTTARSSYDEISTTEETIEETSTTYDLYSYTDSYYDYTTARYSYDEISTTDTYKEIEEDTTQQHEHVEVTTELDKYQLSQNIYTIAQDISNKANEMSSVTSEISSKISDINNLISDINTDEDEIREKVQTLNRYTQELSSKTSEISSLSSEASRLSSDISSASQDIPSSEKVQSHRITPWQKITQKAQDLITATQSMVTASQEIITKSQEITTLSENLKPEKTIANLIYDINSRVQGIITEALDVVTAVVEVLTLVEQ